MEHEQLPIWFCHLRSFVCTSPGGWGEVHQHFDLCKPLFTFTLWSAVRAEGVLFVLILEFSERKMARYLDEALNEPVDDSGSEDVSETEYSPWQEYYNILTIVFKYM